MECVLYKYTHIYKKPLTTNIPTFLSPWLSTRLLGQSPVDRLNLWPPPLQCTLLLYYPILQTLQTITGHKIAPTEEFLSPHPPSAGCQQSEIVLVYASPSLPTIHTWQEADLHETIKDCQRRQTQGERCQRTHTEEPSNSLNNTL